MTKPLTNVVKWGHEILAEIIEKGQLVIDLTAGNGYDALKLYQIVGDSGQVIAFDIQTKALQNTQQRLVAAGARVRMHQAEEGPLPADPGVDLVADGHQRLVAYLPGAPQAVIANLGYLPGGDQSLITRPESSLQALRQASELLAPGGRIAVVVYPGHPGGLDEGKQVDQFFTDLSEDVFQVLRMQVVNKTKAPYLLVAEKHPLTGS